MKYKIYRIVTQVVVDKSMFSDNSTKLQYLLEDPKIYDLRDDFESIGDAENSIREHVKDVYSTNFVILPVVSVDYEGEMV